MNYYEHHIGDYDKNTAHLTACEDGIYSRMIRRYYDKEKPLDADVNEVKRVMRARTKEEKAAVDAVLKEFFSLQDDGWHNKICDEVIEKYLAGEPEREVKKANEDNRLKRHRAERAELFKTITDAGEHAPWNIGMTELREMAKRLTNPKPETPDTPKAETQPATAPATLATATQTPIPSHQSPLVLIPQEPTGSLSTTGKPTVAELQQQIDGIPSGLAGAYKPPECPHQKIRDAFAQILPEALQHDTWEGQRPVNLRARWKSLACEFRWPNEATGLAYIEKFFKYIRMSDFLMGKVPPSKGHKQFELSLEFVVGAKAWQRIREGFYHGKKD